MTTLRYTGLLFVALVGSLFFIYEWKNIAYYFALCVVIDCADEIIKAVKGRP